MACSNAAGHTSSVVVSWKLLKYARHVSRQRPSLGYLVTPSNDDQSWEMFDGTYKELVFEISSSFHMVVKFGNIVQENCFILNSKEWLKGISKGDSMLFVLKIQNACRRFRIKFASTSTQSGVQACQSCADRLQRHFHIKRVPTDEEQTHRNEETSNVLRETVPLAAMAQAVSGQINASLPLDYPSIKFPDGQLDCFLRLCLTDSGFPQFVGEVETALDRIIKEDMPMNSEQ